MLDPPLGRTPAPAPPLITSRSDAQISARSPAASSGPSEAALLAQLLQRMVDGQERLVAGQERLAAAQERLAAVEEHGLLEARRR